MSRRIEWRSRPPGDDNLVAVEDGVGVRAAWPADSNLLTDFLNDMEWLRADSQGNLAITTPEPSDWGDLVISRSYDGGVLFVDPELYWNGIAEVFRSRGNDPHLWRAR
jgi:hypothetical protein